MKKYKFHGFTLVELLIAVTILGILSTIGFLSFQGHIKNARDSSRTSVMNMIKSGLYVNQLSSNKMVLPDDYTLVYASGQLMGYEGVVGENVITQIGLNKIPLDPKTGENYIYYTNKARNKVQIMGFLEGKEMTYLGINKAQASGSGTKIPKVIGDNLGMILDLNYNRVTGTGIDILTDNILNIYNVYFSDADTFTSSGKDLFTKLYNRRSDLLNDKNLANLDESLVLYFDMETLTGSKLKDFSKYGNHGTLTGGIIVGGVNGMNGKATYFDGINDKIIVSNNSSLSLSGELTIIAQFSPINNYNPDILSSDFQAVIDKGWASSFSLLLHNPSSTLSAYYNSNTKFGVPDGVDYNNYNFVGYTFKTNSAKLFHTGKVIKEVNPGMGIMVNNLDLFIGSTAYNNYFLKGTLDSLRIYNRALSEAEIKELYNSLK